MRPDRRRRVLSAAVVSVAVHAALLVALLTHAPRVRIYAEDPGPPQAIIPVLILPRAPPATAGAPPTPIRLHRRAQRFAPTELPIAPLVTPTAEPPATPSPAQGPRTLTGPPAPSPSDANARRALRGLIGCANPSLLTREERERCEDRFAAGGKDAPYLGTGIDRDKAAGLAGAAAKKEADRRYREGNPGVGVSGINDPSAPGRTNIPPTTPQGSTRDGRVPPPGTGSGAGPAGSGGRAGTIRF